MTEDEIVAAAIVINSRNALNAALAVVDLDDLPEVDVVLLVPGGDLQDDVIAVARGIPVSAAIAELVHMRDLLELCIQQMCGTVQ